MRSKKPWAPPPKPCALGLVGDLYTKIEEIFDGAPNPADLEAIMDGLGGADWEDRKDRLAALEAANRELNRVGSRISETNAALDKLRLEGPLDDLNGILTRNSARNARLVGGRGTGRVQRILTAFEALHPRTYGDEPEAVTRLRYELEDLAADIGEEP